MRMTLESLMPSSLQEANSSLVLGVAGDEEHAPGPLQLLQAPVALDTREHEVEHQAGQEDGEEQEGEVLHHTTLTALPLLPP